MSAKNRILNLALLLFCGSPLLAARSKDDWRRAMKLKPGASVYITLWKGQPVSGRLVTVSENAVTIETRYPWDKGIPEKLERGNIMRIVLVRHRVLPDGEKVLVGATLIGGAVGATAGALEHRHDENGQWIVDGLAGIGVGFFFGCVADIGFGVAAAFHHDRLVYESNRAHSKLIAESGLGANLRDGPRHSQIEDPR